MLKEEGYASYWSCSKTKKGYAGTAAFIKGSITLPSSSSASSTTNGGGKKQQTLHSFMKKKDDAATAKKEEKEGPAGSPMEEKEKGVLNVLDVTYGFDGDGNDEGRVITIECDKVRLGRREMPVCHEMSCPLISSSIIYVCTHCVSTQMYIVGVYVPNSGMKLERLQYRLGEVSGRQLHE